MIDLVRHPAEGCPSCQARLDGCGAFSRAQPQPGDLTVCMNCGAALAFVLVTPKWTYRLATTAERTWLEQDGRGQEALELAAVMKAMRAGAFPHRRGGTA